MKVGDVVTFIDKESRYAKWFLYQIGVVEEISQNNTRYCRVRWINPVPYFNSYSTYSDFKQSCYEVHDENR